MNSEQRLLVDYAGRRVRAYRNLNRAGWYSIKDPAIGRVVGYLPEVLLSGVQMTVQPAGRERARRERVRNVHAWVTGLLSDLDAADDGWDWRPLYYSPYSSDEFVDRNTMAPVREAAFVRLGASAHYIPR